VADQPLSRGRAVAHPAYGLCVLDLDDGWSTGRLSLEPLDAHHAAELFAVLDDARLHGFIGGEPLSREDLELRYARLANRRSPDGSELWGNWVLRDEATGKAVGTVQVTLPAGGAAAGPAHVAWVVGVEFQGCGYASEAATALVDRLRRDGWSVVADVHPDHVASARVARAAGLRKTDEIVDGEQRWLAAPAAR
jgi:RimJ/RimL family protein N-acetyltransferase